MTTYDRQRSRTCRTGRGPREAAERMRAADGRPFVIRQMRRSDRSLYETGVAALSERSRYLRFAAPVPKLSRQMLDQLMDLDEHLHVAYAALTPDESRLLGVARYVRLEHAPRTAELAIAIADSWQGAGVGTLLLDRLISHARRNGVGSLVAVTLSENHPAKALALKAGFAVGGAMSSYTELRLELPAPRGEPATARAPGSRGRSAQKTRFALGATRTRRRTTASRWRPAPPVTHDEEERR